jgi:hypothetical protein
MEPDDHRTATEGGDTEDGLGWEKGASTKRARLRLALAAFTLIVVLALIVIGVVRIAQS